MLAHPCPSATSLPHKACPGAAGIHCSAGGPAPSTSSRSSPYAVYAGNEASSRAQRSPIITRLTKATTTPSCSVQSARFASNAIKANGPSTLEAIAQPLEMTAYR